VSALIRAELLKLRTVRTTIWLLVLTAGLTAAITVVSVLQIVLTDDAGFAGNQALRSVLGGVGTAGGHLIMLCLGILSLGGEFRHNTITPTLLVEPRRPRVVLAKLSGIALTAVLFAVVAVALALAVAAPWLALTDYPVSFADGELWLQLLGNVLVLVLYGLIGFGLGVLIRNQIVAIVLAVVWVFLLEPILSAVSARWFSWLAPYLPGSAASSLQRAFVPEGVEGAEFVPDFLPMWGGGLVLLAYALLFTAAGSAFVLGRDVT
jgi:ABC-2 type transport system permease protein